MNEQKHSDPYFLEDDFSLRDTFDKYLRYWKWFFLTIVLALGVAFLYLRYYSIPRYEVTATILIKDDRKGRVISELSAFEDLGAFNTGTSIENEIELLRSRSLMERVIRELNLNVTVFVEGNPIPKEYYNDPPVKINFLTGDSSIIQINTQFTLRKVTETGFRLSQGEIEMGEFGFGEPITMSWGEFILTPSSVDFSELGDREIRISISSLKNVIGRYTNAVRIGNNGGNVIRLTLIDPVQSKAVDILNELITQYNQDAIRDKNEVSKNTAAFIDERMRIITSELAEVEGDVASFKTENQLIDVTSEASMFLQSGSENEKSITETNLQVRLVDFMFEYLEEHSNRSDLIPTNLGFTDPSVLGMTETYNALVLERNRLLRSSSERNPVVVNLDARLSTLRNSLNESLQNLKASLEIRAAELSKISNTIDNQIAAVPKYEREFREIQRQQQIKETLYLYLLQKREETAITLAVTIPNAKIIDSAYGSGVQVSPKKNQVYLVSLMIGLMVPIVIVYIRDMLDTKIHGRKDLEKTGIQLVGDIPAAESNNGKLFVTKDKRNRISESFRSLRTNVDFLLNDVAKKGKTIFVTSTISSEGKTFISINLAAAYALSGKKVILVGMDLRAPKIVKYLGTKDQKGVTNYIIDSTLKLDDIIMKDPEGVGFDVLSSGIMPPNPAELLMKERTRDILYSLQERYDYVIVDTAPVGVVTDTLLIKDFADLSLFVARAHYLDKRMLHVVESLHQEKRLPNIALLINGSEPKKSYGYGYQYNYAYQYGEEGNKNWWQKLRTNGSD